MSALKEKGISAEFLSSTQMTQTKNKVNLESCIDNERYDHAGGFVELESPNINQFNTHIMLKKH